MSLISLLQDEPTVELMEDIGFDVGTVGNHEFDEGTDELLRILNGGDYPKGTNGYDGQNFPLVCANCKMKSTGEPFLPAYDIINVGRTRCFYRSCHTVGSWHGYA